MKSKFEALDFDLLNRPSTAHQLNVPDQIRFRGGFRNGLCIWNVSLAGDILTIKGEKRSQHEEKNGDQTYMERRFGSFSRSLRLPFEAGEEKVDAQFSNGVLTVRIPKPTQLQRAVRRIDVRSV